MRQTAVTDEREAGVVAPAPQQRRADTPAERILALQRGAGNQAVARMLDRAVLARMKNLTNWLDGKRLDKGVFRDYRVAEKFSPTLDGALSDGKRPKPNVEALRFLKAQMDDALTRNDMNALVAPVDGIAKLLDNQDLTIDNVDGYATKVVAETRPAAAEAGPAAAAAAGGVQITFLQKAQSDFAAKKNLLSGKDATALMATWSGKLTLQKLDLRRQTSEILKVPSGDILDDSHVRLDGEHLDVTQRYQLFRIQGKNDKYPVLAGVYLQLDTAFTDADIERAFTMALREAKQYRYAVLYSGAEYRAPST